MFDAEWRGKAEEKRKQQKTRLQAPRPPPNFPCPHCPRKFYARIGMLSHLRGHQKRGNRTVKRDARTRANADEIFGSLALTSMLS